MILTDIIKVFRIGGRVKNPATWKNTSATTETIFSILVVLATGLRFFGVDLPVDDGILTAIATAIAFILTAISAITHMITSRKVGVPGLAPVEVAHVESNAYWVGESNDTPRPAKKQKQTMGQDY